MTGNVLLLVIPRTHASGTMDPFVCLLGWFIIALTDAWPNESRRPAHLGATSASPPDHLSQPFALEPPSSRRLGLVIA